MILEKTWNINTKLFIPLRENVISSTYSINYVLAYGSHVGRDQDVPSLTILIYDTPITIFSNLNFNFVSYVK